MQRPPIRVHCITFKNLNNETLKLATRLYRPVDRVRSFALNKEVYPNTNIVSLLLRKRSVVKNLSIRFTNHAHVTRRTHADRLIWMLAYCNRYCNRFAGCRIDIIQRIFIRVRAKSWWHVIPIYLNVRQLCRHPVFQKHFNTKRLSVVITIIRWSVRRNTDWQSQYFWNAIILKLAVVNVKQSIVSHILGNGNVLIVARNCRIAGNEFVWSINSNCQMIDDRICVVYGMGCRIRLYARIESWLQATVNPLQLDSSCKGD